MHFTFQVGEGLSRQAKQISFLIILTIFVFLLTKFWQKTWDDSAITLGFSRNLVKYGDILPSQYSDRVEGYSTFLWMLVNSILFRLGFNEDQVLETAKLLSSFLTVINILIFYKVVERKIKEYFYQSLILILYTLNAATVMSAVFGMETALYTTLVLVSCVLYNVRNKTLVNYVLFSFFASLLILIRHEGILFLAPFIIVTFLNNRRNFLKEPFVYYWALLFASYHLWHFLYFGEILTNPMMAKRYWPYYPNITSLMDAIPYYFKPFAEFASRYMVAFILIAVYYLRFGSNTKNDKDDDWRLFFWLGVVGLFIMLIIGDSQGAAHRLSYPALGFLLLLLFHPIAKVPFTALIRSSSLSKFLVLLGVVFSGYNIVLSFFTYEFYVTVDKIWEKARVATMTQEFIRKDVITYAGPDMGGLILYEGDGKRLIDLGLLSDKRLGKYGYGVLEQYVFEEERPEIIQAHAYWLLPLQTSDKFFEMYFPAKVSTGHGETFLFVRRDIVSDLIVQQMVKMDTYKEDIKDDTELHKVLLKFGNYVIIDLGSLHAGDQ